jgi:hypothetical protein
MNVNTGIPGCIPAAKAGDVMLSPTRKRIWFAKILILSFQKSGHDQLPRKPNSCKKNMHADNIYTHPVKPRKISENRS